MLSFRCPAKWFSYTYLYLNLYSFPGGSKSKESLCNTGDWGSIPGSGRSPREGNGYPIQCSCLKNPRGQRSLAGYSPWGHKKLDTTDWATNTLISHMHIHIHIYMYMCLYLVFSGATVIKNLPANAQDVGDTSSVPGSGRSLGEGNGNPFQYSCLENFMDRGAWQATVHGVTKSGTGLGTQVCTHTHTLIFLDSFSL